MTKNAEIAQPMAIAAEWQEVVEALDRLATYQVLQPTLAAMADLVNMIMSHPAFVGVHPMLSHASLILAREQSSRRVYVGWSDGEYVVAFVSPLMEISEGTTIGRDGVVQLLRSHLARL